MEFVLNAVPSNIFSPFVEYNLLSVTFVAISIGLTILVLPEENKAGFRKGIDNLFTLFMKMTEIIILALPFATWAFSAVTVNKFINNISSPYKVFKS